MAKKFRKISRDAKDPMGRMDECWMRSKMIGIDSKNSSGRS